MDEQYIHWCKRAIELVRHTKELRCASAGDRRERAIFAAAINQQAWPVYNGEI